MAITRSTAAKTVGLQASGADLEVTNNVIVASETVSVTDFSYTAT